MSGSAVDERPETKSQGVFTGSGLRKWGPHLVGVAILLLAFRHLYTLGIRYGFSQGVEYWLFRPNDNAPLVILGLSLWLFYRRTNRLRALPLQTGPWWFIVSCSLAGGVIFFWAVYTSAFDLQVFSLIFLSAALFASYWGLPGVRAVWLPIAFLLFAIPLPAPLLLAVIFKLQIWTAQSSGFMLNLLGLPALVTGDQILRVNQAFQVIEGCSGMRSIQILTMLSILLVDLFQRRGRHAIVLIVAAPIVAFALNGLRVLTLILNPHSEVIAIHNLQGIVILLLGLLIIYGLDTVLDRFPRLSPEFSALPPPSGHFAPNRTLALLFVLATVTQAIFFFGPVWTAPEDTSPPLYASVSEALSKWSSEKVAPDFMFRGSARFGEVFQRRYFMDRGEVSAFVAESDYLQRGGSPLSPITAVPGSGWRVLSDEELELPGGQWIHERTVDKGKRRLLVWYWVLGSEGLLRETWRSFLALDRSPFARPDPIVVVRLETGLESRRAAGFKAASRRLRDVEAALRPVLLRLRPAASGLDS